MPRNTRSKGDLNDGRRMIIEEAQFEEGSGDWLKNDLCSLIQSPLEVQLKAILGASSADSFLHPTIKDKKRATLANSGINLSKKHDAHELWNNLRMQSQRKLNREEKRIPQNVYAYRCKKVADTNMLRNIQFSRHRTELMHRVSQMNRVKAKELLKDFYLPSFDEDIIYLTGTGTELSDVTENEQLFLESLPPEKNSSCVTLNLSGAKLNEEKRSENQLKVKFLSEEDCQVAGQFRKRMEGLGVVVNNGVSVMDSNFKTSSTCLAFRGDSKSTIAPDALQRNASWQPLTMVASKDCKKPITLNK